MQLPTIKADHEIYFSTNVNKKRGRLAINPVPYFLDILIIGTIISSKLIPPC